MNMGMGGWKHEFRLRDPRGPYLSEGAPDIRAWLVEQFGINDYGKSVGTWRYYVSESFAWSTSPMITVKFREAKDAMLFKLTWL